MNSTTSCSVQTNVSSKKPPVFQESIIDLHTDQIRNSLQKLVTGLQDSDIAGGVILTRSGMPTFIQEEIEKGFFKQVKVGTSTKPATRNIMQYYISGHVNCYDDTPLFCPCCGKQLVANGTTKMELQDIPHGNEYYRLSITRQRRICPDRKCGYTWTDPVAFKAQNHMITTRLENYVRDLLDGGLTLKRTAILTGLHQNTVKAIDKERLEEKHTVIGKDGKRHLKKPDFFCECIGIDEFLLHEGHKYATVIIDLKSGRVLYLAHGKKKQTVYDFIEWIGKDWMKHVKAVACDMNSDFEEAFKEKCEWISIVYDHFHIVKNFNDKVVSEVRKDEQKRLIAEGNEEAAAALKGSKYILMTSEKTRKQKEKDAKNGKVISRGGMLFNKPEVKQKSGIEKTYQRLLEENSLLFTLDLVKEKLRKAYEAKTERSMKIHLNRIIKLCHETENKHFEWFANLLERHMDGIVSHVRFHISTGKVEGTNQMIKTLRRTGYGYPDDDYFFLKIIDSSCRYSSLA